MIDDLTCAIEETAVDVTIIRSAPPEVVYGRVQSAPVQRRIPARMSMQPAKSRDLLLLPEGMRNAGAVVGFLGGGEDLLTTDTSTCGVPDLVEWRGSRWQVMSVDDWRDLGGYVRAMLVRVKR